MFYNIEIRKIRKRQGEREGESIPYYIYTRARGAKGDGKRKEEMKRKGDGFQLEENGNKRGCMTEGRLKMNRNCIFFKD